jgi:hypothetical protein
LAKESVDREFRRDAESLSLSFVTHSLEPGEFPHCLGMDAERISSQVRKDAERRSQIGRAHV